MGGAVSAGENNDELIDNLMEANYIDSEHIAEVFRAVDRGAFYLKEYRDRAYHDVAWKFHNLHISAPCIYSKVMTSLDLKPGHSFLNIGSGTGYLSTLAGLLLGCNGINHGIEMHADVVEYARRRVQEFVSKSQAFDRYTFCEPEFVVGNCFHLTPDVPGYDRIYCGAACQPEYESFMKNLLNINGLLVIPLNDQLQVIKRSSSTKWVSKNILVVNFTKLTLPSNDDAEIAILPTRHPQSLSALCRACIREVLSKKFHRGSNRRYRKKIISRTPLDSYLYEFPGDRRAIGRPYFPTLLHSPITSSDSDEEPTSGAIPRLSSMEADYSAHAGTSGGKGANSSTKTKCSDDTSVGCGADKKEKELSPTASPTVANPLRPRKKEFLTSSFRKRKTSKKKSKDENSAGFSKGDSKENDDSKRKLKRRKSGWAYLKEKFKHRKTDKSVPPSSKSTDVEERLKTRRAGQSTSAATNYHTKYLQSDSGAKLNSVNDRPMREQLTYESTEVIAQEAILLAGSLPYICSFQRRNFLGQLSRDESDRPFHHVSIHIKSDAASLRSFLFSLSLNNASPSNDRAISYLSDQKHNENDMESDEIYSAREIALPLDQFRFAILNLPVPEAIKQYLLFYRVAN